MLIILIIVVLLLAAGGSYPRWGYSTNWGYGPSGIIGFILVIIVLIYLLGGRTGLRF